ncbi:hypothetical protein U1Q18_040090 [Sarracenia purpurea var. burkii]
MSEKSRFTFSKVLEAVQSGDYLVQTGCIQSKLLEDLIRQLQQLNNCSSNQGSRLIGSRTGTNNRQNEYSKLPIEGLIRRDPDYKLRANRGKNSSKRLGLELRSLRNSSK